MKVCANCFSDRELQGFIKSLEIKGLCDVCDDDNNIVSIDELQDFFQELIDNFTTDDSGDSLKNVIQGNWSFFSSHQVAKDVLNFILPELNTEILNSETRVNYIDEIVENSGYWEKLKQDLKWKNRFLTNIILLTEDLGWDSFFNTQYKLTSEKTLYRARMHHKSGVLALKPDNMGCPEKEAAKGGRANAFGIPSLYLSESEKTTLYEIRASHLDEVSIGEFQIKDKEGFIKIVDFTEDVPLFQPEMVNETIKAKLLLEKISRDLSKPVRRYDSEIEYIPTQFICEFIKVFTGANGIRFHSSILPSGKNLVIFNNELIECIRVNKVKVSKFSLDFIRV